LGAPAGVANAVVGKRSGCIGLVVTAIWLLMSFTASSACGVAVMFSDALPVSPFGALTLYTKLSGVLIPSAPSPLLSV
jgi:hypothetical protein